MLGITLRPVFRNGVGVTLGLHVLNVNRSRELVVVVEFHGGGQLHQKAGNPAHFNLDLPFTDLEKSGMAIVHAVAMGIVAPCIADGFDKFLLRNISHAAQKSIGQWEKKGFFTLGFPLFAFPLCAKFHSYRKREGQSLKIFIRQGRFFGRVRVFFVDALLGSGEHLNRA